MDTKQITEVYKNGLVKKETIHPMPLKKGILCCMESNLYTYGGNRWEVERRINGNKRHAKRTDVLSNHSRTRCNDS